eukprot:SAG31_NODE_3895_length_3773_cov_21.681818_7_plen_39_part_00
MDFDDATTATPTQEVEFTTENLGLPPRLRSRHSPPTHP